MLIWTLTYRSCLIYDKVSVKWSFNFINQLFTLMFYFPRQAKSAVCPAQIRLEEFTKSFEFFNGVR